MAQKRGEKEEKGKNSIGSKEKRKENWIRKVREQEEKEKEGRY